MMRKIFNTVFLMAAVSWPMSSVQAQTNEVYLWVAPDGDDAAQGTQDEPFATLANALAHVRQLRADAAAGTLGKIHIVMRGGEYRIGQPISLTAEDSGTSTSPTIIEAANGERPVITGGVKIEGWQVVANADGLPDVAQGQVWEAALPTTDGATLDFRQFWVNGQKARRASTLDDLSLPRLISVDKSIGQLTTPRIEQTFRRPEELELTIIQDWTTNTLRIKTLQSDAQRSRLTFQSPESEIEFKRPWPILRADETSFSNHMFYLANAIELLDHPQEWYRDGETGKIYYWPRSGETTTSVEAIAPQLETLVNIEGTTSAMVSHIEWRGITFEHTTWMRPSQMGHIGLQAGQFLYDAYSDESAPGGNVAWVGRPAAAVSVANARRVTFEGCTFQHLGATGLDFVAGTKQMTVRGCAFSDISGTAILGGYFGDEEFESHMVYNPTNKADVCDSITIDNNYIAHIANEDWGCVGIGIGYAANVTISHNELYDTPYSAISLGWGWTKTISCMKNNRIVANHIHNFSNQMRDSGAIYTLSAQPNSSIEDNCIEDVGDPLLNPQMWDMRHAQFDLYLDEGSDYFTVRNNWCERAEFSKNQNGSHNTWGTNDRTVSAAIRNAAGLESAWANVKSRIDVPNRAPADTIGHKNNAERDRIEYVAQNEGFKMGNAIAVDLNGDNRLDIVYGGGESFQVQHGGVRINTGDYSFAATQGIKRLNMANFAAGDLNGDGHIDLVQAGWDFYGNYNAILWNGGDGRLEQKPLATNKNTSPACGIADVNNDGLSDIFFVGNGTDNTFYLQRNNHTFGEGKSALSLPDGMSNPSIAYADFNNDGAVDICVLTKRTGGVFTRMFYNDGTGGFVEANVGFKEYGTRGAMAYADVNNDGWLDIAIGGQFANEAWNATAEQGAKIVTVYLNDQQGGFVKQQQMDEYMFDNVTQPVRFCDWDNDGNADLIVTGWNMTQGNISRTDVFLNDGKGNFTKIEAGLPGVSEGAIELADFGGSGRNDILIHGNCNEGYNGFTGDRRIAVLCRNRTTRANTTPSAPTQLKSEVTGGTVTLSWAAGSDAETNEKALSYNYYLRDVETGLYMTFPNADVETGVRRVSGMGNAWMNREWTLRNLPNGTYAWSVQTIDAAYAGSPFAAEETFTVTDGALVLEPIDYPENEASATTEYNSSRLQLYQYLTELAQMAQRGVPTMLDLYQEQAVAYNKVDITAEEMTSAIQTIRTAIAASAALYTEGEPATYGIVNPGFENVTSQHDATNAAPFGWSLTRNGVNVKGTSTWYWFGANGDGTDKEGEMVWGIWHNGTYGTIELKQVVSGLANGTWRVTARLMNNNTERGNQARLYAGGQSMLAGEVHSYTTLPQGENLNYSNAWATSDGDMSTLYTAYATVTDGTLEIGVRTNGFFKVDDFQLTYLGAETATCPVTIGPRGYALIVTPAPLNLAATPAGLTAYKVTGTSATGELTLETVENAIGQGHPILLYGAAGATYDVPIATSAYENKLTSTRLRTSITHAPTKGNGRNIYTLDNEAETAGFTLVANGVELPGGTAYLQVSASQQAYLPLPADPTGIETVGESAPSAKNVIYNIIGQKIREKQGIFVERRKVKIEN